jgi:ketose-bisphosphate aldolase
MSIPTLKTVLTQYTQTHQALPAFNIDSFEIYQAVELAASRLRLPCLVQLSAGEDQFVQAERLFMLVKKAQADGIPLYLNMDHGQDPNRLLSLIRLGYDMVHFDGSKLDYQQNLTLSTDFVRQARQVNPNIIIEVEFNRIQLADNRPQVNSFTMPSQALEFISKTQANLLAVSIGNLHGVNLDLPEKIDLDLLSQIHQKIPSTFLTLHGGSGISPNQITKAIAQGIVKININTDLRLQFKKSLKRVLAKVNSEKIYDYFTPVVADLAQIIEQKLLFFTHHPTG